MFNKLKQQITNLNSKKKTEGKPEIQEDSDNKDFELDFENLWQYNIEELCEYLRKYEKFSQRLKKKIEEISEENAIFRKKFDQTEKDKRKITDDKDQFKIHLDNIQRNLDMETKEKEKHRLESEALRKEKDKMKLELENLKKDSINSMDISVSVPLSRGNLGKIFKFLEPKYLKNLENKMEEITVFLTENLKIINTGLLDKIKNILSQPEEGKDNLESNRSNLDEEYDNESQRDNMQSARSNRTDGGMSLHDLVVEMYEELHMITGSLPNIENMRLKVQELVENFHTVNETLNKYQGDVKEAFTEEVENMKKELNRVKEGSDDNKSILERKETEIQTKTEEIGTLKNENSKLKGTLIEMQKKFENEIKTLLDQISAENLSLKESNLKIREEYEEICKTKRKLEEDYSNENKKLLKELEEYKANHDNLEKKMKNADESFTSRQKDLESKIQQEKTKFEQKAKDYAKLEESYREYKNNSAKQMDDFNRIIEKAKQIEVQLNDEKKNHKELKMKYNELSSLMDEEKKISSALLKEKDEIKKIFDEKARKLEEEINNQMQAKVNISKDLMIKNLEIKMGELNEKIDHLNHVNSKIQEENDSLKQDLKSNLDLIGAMKDKREAALKEIKRLTTQIDSMKSNNQNKMYNSMAENSYSHIPLPDQKSLKEAQTSADKSRTNISSVDTSQMIKNLTNKSFNKIVIEGNYLTLIKKELEGLYRDFIPLMPWDAEKKQQASFIKLERKMNDCIQKAQDLIDTIEDMA